MTWFEWSLCVERIVEIDERRRHDHELIFEVVRQALVKYFNWNRGSLPAIEPKDVWPMPYDVNTPPATTDTEPTREEKIKAIREVAEKVKHRRKKRDG